VQGLSDCSLFSLGFCIIPACSPTTIKTINNNNNNNKNNNNNNNMIKKEAEKILQYKPYNRNTTHVECKNKGYSSNMRRDWDHFKVI
jgi:23S rRNA pseudoU1915 N3-methylase RlmH